MMQIRLEQSLFNNTKNEVEIVKLFKLIIQEHTALQAFLCVYSQSALILQGHGKGCYTVTAFCSYGGISEEQMGVVAYSGYSGTVLKEPG